ncbi:hypothetical protein H0H87_006715 [Tephrocybe sp. NHM501043]|nr:hypothetical protein H0H87_006715 [Tephrocybe sp. NHM501043]
MHQRLLSLSGLIILLNLVTAVIGHPITLPGQDLQARAKGQTDKAAAVTSPPIPKARAQHLAVAADKLPKTPAEATSG